MDRRNIEATISLLENHKSDYKGDILVETECDRLIEWLKTELK